MADLATVEGIKDWVLALLVGAVAGLLGLVRRQDVGEINRRLDALERWREEIERSRAPR